MQTYIEPIQVIISPGSSEEFTINREHQLEDATLTINDMLAEHQTQRSDAPTDKSFTGLEASLELSISDVTLNFFRRATNSAKYTVGTTRKLEYGDLTGLRVVKKVVLIKPYSGYFPTLEKDNWFTFLNAGIETEAVLNFGRSTQLAYTMRIVAYPDPVTGMKLVRGDVAATTGIVEPEPIAGDTSVLFGIGIFS